MTNLFETDDQPVTIPTFDQWWAEWPRKQGKAEAKKRWRKMSPPERAAAWAATPAWVAYAHHRPAFVPYGSTFLNQSRWEDDPPAVPQPERRDAPGMAAVRAAFNGAPERNEIES